MFIQFIGMTTSGTQAQLEERIPVDTNKAKYNFIAHNDILAEYMEMDMDMDGRKAGLN